MTKPLPGRSRRVFFDESFGMTHGDSRTAQGAETAEKRLEAEAPRPAGRRFALAIAIGFALGVVGARVALVGSWLNLIPWGVAGLLLGAWSRPWWSATLVGAVYGFALAFSFMVAGYRGSLPLATRLAPFAVLGFVGAVAGLMAAITGAAAFAIIARLRR
jgi:hypothetical protein